MVPPTALRISHSYSTEHPPRYSRPFNALMIFPRVLTTLQFTADGIPHCTKDICKVLKSSTLLHTLQCTHDIIHSTGHPPMYC